MRLLPIRVNMRGRVAIGSILLRVHVLVQRLKLGLARSVGKKQWMLGANLLPAKCAKQDFRYRRFSLVTRCWN